jgi:Ca2+-binding RTX toxin-like protein
MTTNTIEAFYLGVFGDLDTNETNWTADNPGALIGSRYGSGSDPLHASIDMLTLNDLNNSGAILENDRGQTAEPLIYQGVSSKLDTVIDYNVTVTFIDGTTATTSMSILQDEAGRMFLVPWKQGSATNNVLNDKPIESIKIGSVYGNDYGGVWADLEQDAFIDGTVNGTAGNDTIGASYTDAGGTQMNAYGGNDTVDAGAGNDSITSGAGNDSILAGAGNDTVYAGADNDTVLGGSGDDSVYGGLGNDSILGDTGNDTLYGEAGNDYIAGGDGRDAITGGSGADTMYGGADSDSFILSNGFGNDRIFGGEAVTTGVDSDKIDARTVTNGLTVTMTGNEAGTMTDGTDTITFSEIESLDLSDGGNDRFDGSATTGGVFVQSFGGNDTLIGGTGYDDLRAGDGNDLIQGGAGGGNLEGGAGNDTVTGGAGSEAIYGNSGNDLLDGAGGNDWIGAGTGADTIIGGAGNDAIDVSGDSDKDIIVLKDHSGNDTIFGFDGPVDTGGGVYVSEDKLDVSNLHDAHGAIVNTDDVTITDTNGDGTGHAILTFPNGESVTFQNVLPSVFSDPAALNAIGIPSPDYVVEGTAGADTIDASYLGDPDGDMVNAHDHSDGSDNDYIAAGAGNDRVAAGAGDDTIDGGDGNDTLDGGLASTVAPTSESLNWNAQGADETDLTGGFTQNTGVMDVSVSFANNGSGNALGVETSDKQYVAGGEPFNEYSAAEIGGTGSGPNSTTTIEFAANTSGYASEVENVQFRLNDIDSSNWVDHVTINAYDGDGNLVPVTITQSGNGDDHVSGNQITGANGTDNPDNESGSATVDIAGPVHRIEIIYQNSGTGSAEIYVTDVHFTSLPATDDDRLTGGAGDDVFLVGSGADTITDFNTGNTGALDDGNSTNNDFIDLSGYYDNLSELYADQADDGILNQSNTTDSKGRAVDYSDNTRFGAENSLTFTGASADNSSFTEENTGVVCFTAGTAIRTPQGDVLIDELRVGDLVCTLDNGPRPIRWIGRLTLNGQTLQDNPNQRPVLIKRGTLGAERDLLVSPQHGVVMGRTGDHLVRAKHLVGAMPGVRFARDKRKVTYIHLMFDAHQIIFAENIASESFYPGHMALSMLGRGALMEVLELFPDLAGNLGTTRQQDLI